jgi:hypothetical protein
LSCSLTPFTFKGKTYQTRWLDGANGGAYRHDKPAKKLLGVVVKPPTTRIFKQGVLQNEKDFLDETNRLKGSEPDPNLASTYKVKMRFEDGKPLTQTDAFASIMKGDKPTCIAWMALVRQAARTEHSRMANTYNIIQLNGNVRNFLWKDISYPSATNLGMSGTMIDLGNARRRTVSGCIGEWQQSEISSARR